VRTDAVALPGGGPRSHLPGPRPAPTVPLGNPGPEPSPFAAVLRGLAAEVDRGDPLTREAMGAAHRPGAPATPASLAGLATADLIALQAGVYRYSEAVELTSRLVDRATGAVKTVLQG
jgi:hypothetical protein